MCIKTIFKDSKKLKELEIMYQNAINQFMYQNANFAITKFADFW